MTSQSSFIAESDTDSKIHLLRLSCPVGGLVARHDSRVSAVLGPSSPCVFAWRFRSRLGLVPHNVPYGVEESRSAGTADGQSLRWLDYVPCAVPAGDTRSRKCFL